MLAKIKAYAKREEPEITASYMDFRKPIDDASNIEFKDDAAHELMTFEAHCYACSALGEVRMCQATIPFC